MSQDEPRGGCMPLRDILAVSDLTLAATNAAWRAAQLARASEGRLRLLHVVRDARPADEARDALAQLADAMQQRLGVTVGVEVTRGELARETVRAAAGAHLLVLPARGRSTLRERISGTATERLVRASRIPVLVVKRPVARTRDSVVPAPQRQGLYGRVLVCVDLGAGASAVIAAASRVSGDRIEVFHALRADRQAAAAQAQDAPGTVVERARAALLARIAQAGAGSAVAAIGLGEPGASVVAKGRAVGAELVVLGKREPRWLADLFPSGVTREVLAGSPCDVLLVPAQSSDGIPQLLAPG